MPTATEVKTLVGLEIHVQLATASKMFTAAKNGFGGEPNAQVDPMVMGLPGTLPVMNKLAVEHAMVAGLALGCRIADRCKWDRKSYYYPDLPKNYQISQYDQPLCGEGTYDLTLPDGSTKQVRIRRAHLEEDAGKLLHDAPGGYHIDYSIVDLNRAGTPLLEIVTEPDFDSPETVAAFARELQQLVQYLGVSEGQMQMGHMRFEPNINVHITDENGTIHKTAITEVKNLNSFSVLEKAVAYEVKRQTAAFEESGDLGKKATYGWDDATQQTVLQREKEEAHDYRYFPDPDLMPVEVTEDWLTELKGRIGELPAARRLRYSEEMKLNDQQAADLSQHKAIGDYFDAVVTAGAEPKRAAAVVEALREMSEGGRHRRRRFRRGGRGRGEARGRVEDRGEQGDARQGAPQARRRRLRRRRGRRRLARADPVERHRRHRRRHRRDDRGEPQAAATIPGGQAGRVRRTRRQRDEARQGAEPEARPGTPEGETLNRDSNGSPASAGVRPAR